MFGRDKYGEPYTERDVKTILLIRAEYESESVERIAAMCDVDEVERLTETRWETRSRVAPRVGLR